MRKHITRIRHATPREITYRILEELRFIKERFEVKSFRKLPIGANLQTKPAILFNSINHLDEIREKLLNHFPRSAETTISLANGIISNRIPIFSDIVDFAGGIDWHLDYKSGKRAPKVFYRDIHNADPSVIGDPKNIWETNRCNFLVILAKAFLITGDIKYYEKWKELIISWIDDNPHKIGINWESSIELAFRAINWIWSSYFFSEQLQKDELFIKKICSALYLHARHIKEHLSYFYSPNTHLTGEALGLLYIGKTYPHLDHASDWVSEAEKILEEQWEKHILPDGGYFERATYYHNYTIDFYTHYLLIQGGTDYWPDNKLNRFKKMIQHLALISEPDGTIPLLGDSDGGQLLTLSHSKNNIHSACCIASIMFRDGTFKHLCHSNLQEDALWLLGPEAAETFQKISAQPLDSYHSENRDTGLYCFRTGIEPNDQYILIDCGPHGWKICGHAHSDLLSFEWYSRGAMIIVDPGTCTYYASKKARDHDRTSQSHNTITINDTSQSEPGDTFKWRKIAYPKYSEYNYLDDFGYFEGTHNAYDTIGCQHRRAVLFFGKALIVVLDLLSNSNKLESMFFNLQLNEGQLRGMSNGIYQFTAKNKDGKHYIRFFHGADVTSRITEGAICPDYNKRRPAPRMVLSSENISSDQMIITLLSDDLNLLESFELDDYNVLKGGKHIEYSIDLHTAHEERNTRLAIVHKDQAFNITDGQIKMADDAPP